MKNFVIVLSLIALISCKKSNDGWEPLFNGKDLSGWHVYGSNDDFNGWHVENQVLIFDPEFRTQPDRVELVTDALYTNFELSLEWKAGQYANSGLMWGVVEEEQYQNAYNTGPEIQILDENWVEYIAQNGNITRAGSLYGLLEPSKVVSKTGDQWNHYLLHIDHEENLGWLQFNGEEVLRFPVHGVEWERMIANSRFAESPGFGKASSGHIALQEYGGKISFRDVKIKVLQPDQ